MLIAVITDSAAASCRAYTKLNQSIVTNSCRPGFQPETQYLVVINLINPNLNLENKKAAIQAAFLAYVELMPMQL